MLLFIKALILALALEGFCFALFPELMRKAMLEAASLSPAQLRALGGMALAGAAFCAFALKLFA